MRKRASDKEAAVQKAATKHIDSLSMQVCELDALPMCWQIFWVGLFMCTCVGCVHLCVRVCLRLHVCVSGWVGACVSPCACVVMLADTT